MRYADENESTAQHCRNRCDMTLPHVLLDVGKLGVPHGVKGALFVHLVDRQRGSAEIPGYKKIWIGKEPAEAQAYVVQKWYHSGDWIVVLLSGLTDRTQAENLHQLRVFVERKDLVLAEDEVLTDDLIGCSVWVDGNAFGVVTGVTSFGAQDNLEIKRNKDGVVILFPYLKSVILNEDIVHKRIDVAALSEFLDQE